jgi:hypothetical protein
LPLSLLFLDGTLTDCVHPLPVYEITRTWTSCKLTIYSFPMLFEIRLNMLQAIKSRHLAWLFGWRRLAATLPSRLTLSRHFGRMRGRRLLHGTCLALAHNLTILRRILRPMPLILLPVATRRVRVMCRVLHIVLPVFHLGSWLILVGGRAVWRLVRITHLVI